MENTVVERAPVWDGAPGEWALSFPDVETFVSDCISTDENESSVHQKLMGAISQAEEGISKLDDAGADQWIECLSLITKGLRRNTEESHAFRFFYYGQFQTRVDMLEQDLERSRSEAQILSVASRKHFAPIMQMLYSSQICQQQEISDKLGIDRSNLSREMQRLQESGLVDSDSIGRFKYYHLTPKGRRYYNTYLTMKAQLEEQVYSPPPPDDEVSFKEAYKDSLEAAYKDSLKTAYKASLKGTFQQTFWLDSRNGLICSLPDSERKIAAFPDRYMKLRIKIPGELLEEGQIDGDER